MAMQQPSENLQLPTSQDPLGMQNAPPTPSAIPQPMAQGEGSSDVSSLLSSPTEMRGLPSQATAADLKYTANDVAQMREKGGDTFMNDADIVNTLNADPVFKALSAPYLAQAQKNPYWNNKNGEYKSAYPTKL